MKYIAITAVIGTLLMVSCEEDEPAPLDVDPCEGIAYSIAIEVVQQPFSDQSNGIIQVNLADESSEGLQYSLNDTLYQEWPTFSGLAGGSYQLFIRDLNDCRQVELFTLDEIPLFELTVEGGTGSGSFPAGTPIEIEAFPPTFAMEFTQWEGNVSTIQDLSSIKTTIIVPAANTIVRPAYDSILYDLTVSNGTGSGSYPYARTIILSADDPPPGQLFASWIGDTGTITDSATPETQLSMPAEHIAVEATYEEQVFPVSYSQEIAPLFEAQCTVASCHGPGDENEGDLTTYEGQVELAASIRINITIGFMPSPPGRLTQEEIDKIVQWIDSGTPNN